MIAKILKGLGIVVFLIAVGVAALFAFARFHDGPIALIPGGPLLKGELVTAPVADWSFAKDVPEIELQLAYQKTSRTTWVLVKDGAAYVPCSLAFPPGKRWYKDADQDGAATVRIEGKLYPVTLVRVKDDALRKELGQVALSKYMNGARPPEGEVWFFALEPRVSGRSPAGPLSASASAPG